MTIDQLKALQAKATAGEWESANGHIYTANSLLASFASVYKGAGAKANCELATAAVNALPALLAIAEKAKAMVDYWDSDEDDKAQAHIDALHAALAALEEA